MKTKRLNLMGLIFVIVFSLSSLLTIPTYADLYSGKKIVRVSSPDFSPSDLYRLQKMLGLEVGEAIDERNLDTQIPLVLKDKKFLTIFIEERLLNTGIEVILRGEKASKLKGLTFVCDNENIQSYLTENHPFQKKTTVFPKDLKQLQVWIETFLQEKGFYSPDINISRSESKEGGISLVIQVSLRSPTRISKVNFYGVPSADKKDLASLILAKEGKIFNQADVNESIKLLEENFRKNQYVTSKVKRVEKKISEDRNSVEIDFYIDLNDKFQFLFHGNVVLNELELRQELTGEMLLSNNFVKELSAAIQKKYQSIGYHFCEINISTTQQEDTSILSFDIDEKQKVRIDRWLFIGNFSPLTESYLEELFFKSAPPIVQRRIFWEEGVSQTIQDFKAALKTLGFLNPYVSSPRINFSSDQKGVEVVINIDVGNQTLVRSFQWKGNKNFPDKLLEGALNLPIGEPFNLEVYEEKRGRIISFYESKGFLDVKLNSADKGYLLSSDKKGVSLIFDIEEGAQFSFGKATIEGNQRTKDEVIQREMQLHQGDLFDPQKVKESEERVAGLGLFNKTEFVTEPGEEKNTKNLKIVLKEAKPGLGEIGTGGYFEDPLLRLRAFLGLGYKNLFGLNQSVSSRTEFILPMNSSGDLVRFVEYSGAFGYRNPYPLQVPITFATDFIFDSYAISFINNQIRLQSRTTFESRIEKRISSVITALFRLYHLERTKTESLGDANSAQVDLIGSLGPGLIIDFRDDSFNPLKGSYHLLSVELASPVLFSNENISFLMAISRNTFFIPILSGLNLNVYGGFGYGRSLFSGKPIPQARLDKELALGGRNSIRGFGPLRFTPTNRGTVVEETLFANFRAELSFEVVSNWSAALFLDSGQIFPNMTADARHDGAGIGLRYKTPVGPLTIDLAQGLGADRENIKFYFSVGTL